MDVAAWLERLGLGEYAAAFAANHIDEAMLAALTADDLRELGVASLGHRKKLLEAIAELAHQPLPPAETPQHRQVAVLFADLVGFTDLTSRLDAEDLHRLIERFYALADAAIVAAGGSVDKHLGDGIMALFGAPIAHGDDALRALRAADALHGLMPTLSREMGHELRLHVGIAAGEAIVGGLGADRSYTALGDAVNFAARIVALAASGETVLSDDVRLAVPQTVKLEDRGRQNLRGIAGLQQLWRLVDLPGATARPARPLVGRAAELDLLRTSLETARQGRGRTVMLRGEPGIGKTRLLEEARQRALDSGFVVHTAQVTDFGGGRQGDAQRQLLQQLTRTGDPDAADLTPLLAAALQAGRDQPLSADAMTAWQAIDETARAAAMHEILALLVRRMATRTPLLVAVEDLHWADENTLAAIGRLAAVAADHAILLLLTARGDGDPLERGLREKLSGLPLTLIDLTPLNGEEATALAGRISGLDGAVVGAAIERAGGNPLFLEQLLRNAMEGGADQLPGSLRSLVLARFDRLPASDQRILEAASVLGQRFEAAALSHVARQANCLPQAALRAGLLRIEGAGFAFAHALIREGIYRSLLRARRNEMHALAAQFHGGRDLPLRAEHLERGGDAGAPLAYLEAAASERAAFRARNAIALADRGLALTPDAAIRPRLLAMRAEALLDSGQARAAQDAFVLALAAVEDERERCNALVGLAGARRIIEDLQGALDALERAQAIAATVDDAEALSRIHNQRGNIYFAMGRARECVTEQNQALAQAERSGSTEAVARALGGQGDAEYARGRMRRAVEAFVRCVDVAREAGLGRIEVANAPMVAVCRMFDLDIGGMLKSAGEAIALAQRVGQLRPEMIAQHAIMQAAIESQRFDLVPPAVERAQFIVHEIGALRFEPENLIFLADMQERSGDVATARATGRQAIAALRATGSPSFIGPAVLAIAARLAEDRDSALACLAEAETFLARTALAHNYFYIRREGIDLGWKWRDVALIRTHAVALADFIGDDYTAWPVFVMERAEILMQAIDGRRDALWRQRLAALRRSAAERQLFVFDRALAEAEAMD